MSQSLFNLYLFQLGLAFLCVGTTGGSGGMEWVAVLCLLSGEWWPGVICVRLDGQLMSDVHLFSPAFSVLVEGQGQFRQPPLNNYDLPLDPYQATSFITMACAYEEFPFRFSTFTYTWAQDGATIRLRQRNTEDTILAAVRVPNGDYDSSVEGTYTCTASFGSSTRRRNIIVTLPGKPSMHLTYLSHTQSGSIRSISW